MTRLQCSGWPGAKGTPVEVCMRGGVGPFIFLLENPTDVAAISDLASANQMRALPWKVADGAIFCGIFV